MKKWCLFLLGCLLFTFVLGACGKEEETKIALGEVTRSVFYTPMYVAIENDYFADEGLDVTLQTTWGGDKTMTALLSNSIDIALVGSETSIYVHAQDATDPVINFAQLTETDGTFLVAKDEHKAFAWDDLKESHFLGQRKGGMPQMIGEYILKKNTLDIENDLEFVQNIDHANIPSAFATGDYDYVQLFEPVASTMEKEGKGYVVASFGEESGLLPYTVFMAKESFLTENEAVVKSFTKAIYRAQKWVEENNPADIAEVVMPYFDDVEMDILTASIERYAEQGSFAADPILTEAAWDNLQDIMDEANELPAYVPYEVIVNTEIAEEVIAEWEE